MLTNFRQHLERILERDISSSDLEDAIEAAKSDVVMNDLVLGKGVTAEQFEEIVIRCLRVLWRCEA